jgi:hypothetical protein
MMKLSTIGIATLASIVLAAPQGFSLSGALDGLIGSVIESNLERQTGKKRPTGPDNFVLNGCVPNVLVVARGTSETGNVVSYISSAIS